MAQTNCPRCGVEVRLEADQLATRALVECPECHLEFPPLERPQSDWQTITADDKVEHEPWCYRFLTDYAKLAQWLGITSVVLASGMILLGLISSSQADKPGGCFQVVLLGLLVGFSAGSAILGFLFFAALILLAVDAARNLREVRRLLREGQDLPRRPPEEAP